MKLLLYTESELLLYNNNNCFVQLFSFIINNIYVT